MQPFWLTTTDDEQLFCWHVLPLDTYLQNEDQLVMSTTTGEVVDELKGTIGGKLLRADPEARVVVNFHGVSRSFFLRSIVKSCISHSDTCTERRPFGTRLAPVDLPLDLWHSAYPPSDL